MSRAKIGLDMNEWRALRTLGRNGNPQRLDATCGRALVAAGLAAYASADDEKQTRAKELFFVLTSRGAEVYEELHKALAGEGSLEA